MRPRRCCTNFRMHGSSISNTLRARLLAYPVMLERREQGSRYCQNPTGDPGGPGHDNKNVWGNSRRGGLSPQEKSQSTEFFNGFIAVRKSEIHMPESSNRTKSAAVMPWRSAICNTSMIAHSTSLRFGSMDRSILFIIIHLGAFAKCLYFPLHDERMSPQFPLRAFSKIRLPLRISDPSGAADARGDKGHFHLPPSLHHGTKCTVPHIR